MNWRRARETELKKKKRKRDEQALAFLAHAEDL
jgi:hypothetical protein